MASTRRRTRSRLPGDPNKVIGYVRVSTGDQALGPEAQRTTLLAWCAAQGCTLVHVFFDQAVRGAAPANQRPGLSAALAGVKQHGAGILLVATFGSQPWPRPRIDALTVPLLRTRTSYP